MMKINLDQLLAIDPWRNLSDMILEIDFYCFLPHFLYFQINTIYYLEDYHLESSRKVCQAHNLC